MEKIVERFLSYIAIDTMSDPKSTAVPSTDIQFNLLNKLKAELESLGLEVRLDKEGYIYSTLKSNTDKPAPSIGFIAHVDTSPALRGGCSNPQIVNYTGGDIRLNDEYSITETEFPILKKLVGKTIITTDGTTLLAADDKAGIAEIMTAVEYLIEHPEIEHGDIRIAFTPDEEIGRGADYFDVKGFGADFAYTMDGGELGEFEYESFNAAAAILTVKGKSVHPGTAKNVMLNASYVAMEFNSLLPAQQRPEYTEKREGFFMLNEMSGDIETASLEYIVRDHDRLKFEERKKLMQSALDYINAKYGNVAKLELIDTYYNMGEVVEPHTEIIDLTVNSMKEIGIEPIIQPIRGGTDGSRLSFMGLPCPNIFAGGHNFHGRFEMVAIEDMVKAADLIVQIAKNAVNLKY